MSQFVRLLRGLSISSVIILRLFRSGYVTFLPPPNFKTSFHEFLMHEFLWYEVWAINWHVLYLYTSLWTILDVCLVWKLLGNRFWIGGAPDHVVLILTLRLVLFASFWQCWSFHCCFSSDSWHRTLGVIYIRVVPVMRVGIELFRDSSEMKLILCDVILGMDWISWHQVVLICLRARVLIPGVDESFYCLHATCWGVIG